MIYAPRFKRTDWHSTAEHDGADSTTLQSSPQKEFATPFCRHATRQEARPQERPARLPRHLWLFGM
jgi:hypothetical protein